MNSEKRKDILIKELQCLKLAKLSDEFIDELVEDINETFDILQEAEEIAMKNESGLVFSDISSEKYRTYEFNNGAKVTITEPTYLNVSKSGGHRVLDKSGVSHYIPTGWIHLYWEVFDGKPNFVK